MSGDLDVLAPEVLFAWSCSPPRPAAVLVLSLAGSAVSATPVGLVAAYGFNECAGTSTADATGGGNTGTISGRPGARPGGFGKGFVVRERRSADVRIADSAALHLTIGMTLEAWVNPSVNGGSWRTIVFNFLGLIDDVRVYNRPLQTAGAQSDMASGAG